MPPILWFFLSIIAYVGGLTIFWKITPRLFALTFDEGLFMALAALDILGGLLAFSGVVVSLSAFYGSLGMKIVDFFLLLGIFWLALRMTLRSFRGRGKAIQAGHIIAGSYSLFLSAASIFAIVQLFR